MEKPERSVRYTRSGRASAANRKESLAIALDMLRGHPGRAAVGPGAEEVQDDVTARVKTLKRKLDETLGELEELLQRGDGVRQGRRESGNARRKQPPAGDLLERLTPFVRVLEKREALALTKGDAACPICLADEWVGYPAALRHPRTDERLCGHVACLGCQVWWLGTGKHECGVCRAVLMKVEEEDEG